MNLCRPLGMTAIWLLASATGLPQSAPESAPAHFFDEDTGRHLTITPGEGAKVAVTVRFPGGPGLYSRWFGEGTRQERDLHFSRVIGPEEPRGSLFTARTSASRVEVGFKPDQAQPADEGINGTYRRLSDDKRLSMARKDFKAAEDALEAALKKWGPAKDPNLVEWKRRWPDLRARWTAILFPPAKAAPAAPATPAPRIGFAPAAAPDGEKQAEYWIAQAESTGQAIGFVEAPPPPDPIPANGSGDYQDGFGGSASLRMRPDGAGRLGLGCQRGPDEGMGSNLSVEIPATAIVPDKAKAGDWTAVIDFPDPELPAGETPARFRLRKSGPCLWIDAENARRYTGKAWFDGVYRWGPVPVE
jgi:hypothetical protein